MLKHDIENASVTITRLTKAINPALLKMTQYIRVNQAFDVVNEKQLEILERSMVAIAEEANKIAALSEQLMRECEVNSNAK